MYEDALAELRAGRKRSHWIWFVFPQIDGLGFSSTARHYAIKSLDEARAYLGHAVLGARLLDCTRAVNALEGRSAHSIFGSPDNMKFRSCMTLFELAGFESTAGEPCGFSAALEKYYNGERDAATLNILGRTA